jgi:molybdate transport system permease protein
MNWFPVYLSLKVASCATVLALVTGIPLAWLLARKRLPLSELLSSLVLLPIVLPPTVLGYYLLLLIGRQSALGRFLDAHDVVLVFTWPAAVLAAAVVAVPLVIRATQSAFEAVDLELEDAARVFGASEWGVFLRVTLPLAGRGILAGAVLAFARGMGEFGATLMVAGNIPNQTQTLAIAIYDAVEAGNDPLANSLVVIISAITAAVLLVVGRLTRNLGL